MTMVDLLFKVSCQKVKPFSALDRHFVNNWVKLYKSGAFIVACYDIFLKLNNRVWYHEWGTGAI